MRRLVLVSTLSLLLAGCPEKKPTENNVAPAESKASSSVAAAPSTSASSAASATATGDAADGGKAAAHMAHCPSAVTGSTVAIKDVEGGVEVAVTGADDAAAKEIRSRMANLVESSKSEAEAGVRHTGHGEGHGTYGRCTIVMKNTKLEMAEIPNGVKAKVLAKDKSEVDWLRRETRDRDKEAKAPGGDTAGSHRMAHCPSAVEGAKTAVKDTKEGVVVTVTGPADKVSEIRERAKHAAAIAKQPDPPKVEHTGNGTGGGGLGHCPIDPEGDDTIDLKDVEGGVEATVKTKKDVAALQKETRLRAGNFGSK